MVVFCFRIDSLLNTCSVTLVLIFGEIVPSAVFTGPDQLRIAASMVPFVRGKVRVLYLVNVHSLTTFGQ